MTEGSTPGREPAPQPGAAGGGHEPVQAAPPFGMFLRYFPWPGQTVCLLTRETVTDSATAGIVFASGVFMLKFKTKEPVIVALGALAGVLLR